MYIYKTKSFKSLLVKLLIFELEYMPGIDDLTKLRQSNVRMCARN